MNAKKRIKQMIRAYEEHVLSGAPVTAKDGFLHMDLCKLIVDHANGMADDAILERKVAEIEGMNK